MKHKRILLMFISEISGHQQSSIAVEEALRLLDPRTEILNINAFNFTNPVLEKIINRTYMSVIKNMPEIWGYLYDNPKVVKRTQGLKNSIHKHNSARLKKLLDEFKPDGVACTQAFPCGMVADFKKYHNLKIPIVGILTDYAPHSYWVYNNVDAYVVPSEETGRRLIENGIPEDRVKAFGTPISPKFEQVLDKERSLKKIGLKKDLPTVLIMGGGQGLGPIKKTVWELDRLAVDLQIIVVTGSNRRLYNYLKRRQERFRKSVEVYPFVGNIDELMTVSTLVVTKPGGLTTAEALSKQLPMIIIDPLPGQEAMNTDFLLSKKLAIKVKDEKELTVLIEELLDNPGKLDYMRSLSRRYARPDAAFETAKLILRLA